MKHKNVRYTGTPERLQELKEETEFIGRDCELKDGVLTVFAIDRKHGKKRRAQEKKSNDRNKRDEKFRKRPDKTVE